jgi:hypothetical protein
MKEVETMTTMTVTHGPCTLTLRVNESETVPDMSRIEGEQRLFLLLNRAAKQSHEIIAAGVQTMTALAADDARVATARAVNEVGPTQVLTSGTKRKSARQVLTTANDAESNDRNKDEE